MFPNRTESNRKQTVKHLKCFFLNGINKSHQMTLKKRLEIYCAKYSLSKFAIANFSITVVFCLNGYLPVLIILGGIINYGVFFFFRMSHSLESKAQSVSNDDDSNHDIDDALSTIFANSLILFVFVLIHRYISI